jgi:hypothetical protein
MDSTSVLNALQNMMKIKKIVKRLTSMCQTAVNANALLKIKKIVKGLTSMCQTAVNANALRQTAANVNSSQRDTLHCDLQQSG